jgi:hypothetical protein
MVLDAEGTDGLSMNVDRTTGDLEEADVRANDLIINQLKNKSRLDFSNELKNIRERCAWIEKQLEN